MVKGKYKVPQFWQVKELAAVSYSHQFKRVVSFYYNVYITNILVFPKNRKNVIYVGYVGGYG